MICYPTEVKTSRDCNLAREICLWFWSMSSHCHLVMIASLTVCLKRMWTETSICAKCRQAQEAPTRGFSRCYRTWLRRIRFSNCYQHTSKCVKMPAKLHSEWVGDLWKWLRWRQNTKLCTVSLRHLRLWPVATGAVRWVIADYNIVFCKQLSRASNEVNHSLEISTFHSLRASANLKSHKSCTSVLFNK